MLPYQSTLCEDEYKCEHPIGHGRPNELWVQPGPLTSPRPRSNSMVTREEWIAWADLPPAERPLEVQEMLRDLTPEKLKEARRARDEEWAFLQGIRCRHCDFENTLAWNWPLQATTCPRCGIESLRETSSWVT